MCLQPFLTDNLREMCTIARDYVNKKNATVPPPDFEELPRMARILAHPKQEEYGNQTLERIEDWFAKGKLHVNCGRR
eukprot:gene7492-16701_t